MTVAHEVAEIADVLVAGGGSAGLAAAVTAAREGARTVLIERCGMLGGMATTALVHSICGLYRLREEATPPAPAHEGFPAEFATHLLARDGAIGPVRIGRVDLLLHRPPDFAALADDLTAAEPNLTVRLHTELLAAQSEADRITQVEITTRGVRRTIRAKAFIDTTGDGALAVFAGAATEQAATLQRPAFIAALGGIETAALDNDGRLRIAQRLVAGVRGGAIPRGLLGAHFRASGRPGEVYVTFDLDDPDGSAPFDPCSPASLTTMEQYGRRLLGQMLPYLKQGVPAFREAFVAALPARIGIRESRRIIGLVQLTGDDILEGRTFPDAVALSTWPIELREQTTGPRLRFPREHRPCEIPLRALTSRDRRNLFMAGRCLSATHEAQAALRVIGTCLATGEAAGRAAAQFAASCDHKNIGSGA